jgi:hypothetical protein
LTLLADHMTPRDLQELAGHADVHTTMSYYVHAKEEAQQRGAAALAAAITLQDATDVRPNGAFEGPYEASHSDDLPANREL